MADDTDTDTETGITPRVETTRAYAVRLDAADPLAGFRERCVIADPDLRYLDGNSLGRLPIATVARLRDVVEREWGDGLVRSWSHWVDLPTRVGDALAGLIGARPGEVLVADSTTVNLYKLAAAAVDARPGRRVIVTDDDNFPTDRYVLEGLAARHGLELRLVHTDPDDGLDPVAVAAALDGDVAVASFSHVAYRSGALADLAAVTAAVHDVGALALWDLSHAAGSVPVPLTEAGVDLAVGCTYKYLHGGPGAPAYLYVRRDTDPVRRDTDPVRRDTDPALRSPVWGWFAQRDLFAMGADVDPLPGAAGFAAGTPPVLGLVAVEEGVRLVTAAGVDRLRAKSLALTAYLVELADEWLVPLGFRLASPRDPARRGGHVTLHHPDARRICGELAAAGVIGDYREPDRLRLAPTPMTTRWSDVWDALDVLRRLVADGRPTRTGTPPGGPDLRAQTAGRIPGSPPGTISPSGVRVR